MKSIKGEGVVVFLVYFAFVKDIETFKWSNLVKISKKDVLYSFIEVKE